MRRVHLAGVNPVQAARGSTPEALDTSALARFEASALGSFQAGPPAEAGHRAGADLPDQNHRAAHQPAGAGRWIAGRRAADLPYRKR